MTMSCENNQRTIDVVGANYGRLDTKTCNYSKFGDTNCKGGFFDPYPGTFKYLEVEYKCVNLG